MLAGPATPDSDLKRYYELTAYFREKVKTGYSLPLPFPQVEARHGTTTLFAALEVATGRVTDACYPRHRHEEFLRFLKQVAKAYPRAKLHLVVDNYATHKHPAVQAWLAKHPRITMHFTPTSGSWLNMVEIFFGIITRQAIRRGTFTSVKDLIAAIEAFIDGWNERCQPFVWTKPPTKYSPRHAAVKDHRSRDTRTINKRQQGIGIASRAAP